MTGLNTLNNAVQRWAGASQAVVSAVKNASARTGVSFDYLMSKARQESSFDTHAKAKTSSATGLFQFIDSTWLSAVREHGAKFGLGDIAAKIDASGKVADAQTKQQILKLRENPEVAANLTAAMTKDNADFLSTSLGGKVGENELYLAHFMGLGGANKFLKARMDNPSQAAADLFPSAAAANKNVFYDTSGRKRSLDQVYDFFAQKITTTTGADKPVVDSVVAIQQIKQDQPLMFSAAGSGFVISPDIAASQGLTVGQTAQRQMLETLLSGMDGFGFGESKETKTVRTGNLLSPYTSMILASMQMPGEGDRQNSALFG
jgi:hypothetical protein